MAFIFPNKKLKNWGLSFRGSFFLHKPTIELKGSTKPQKQMSSLQRRCTSNQTGQIYAFLPLQSAQC